ncbi:hypothetical protein D3C76_1027020 [compost metagenome]
MELNGQIRRLQNLENELSRVEVPLSYYHELYELHLHLSYVIQRLEMLRDRARRPDGE